MLTEKQTREKIDIALSSAGWNVANKSQVVEEFFLKHTKEFVDYVLLGKDGLPIAVIEAKKSSRDANIGREQAKQYCQNIADELSSDIPFCFYTNGNDIYFWDVSNYSPRKIYNYPKLEDMERLLHIRKYKKPLSHEFINVSIAGRDYQISAIRSVMEAIDKKRRDFLLVMATGTGKTRTTIALIDALMRSGIVKNTLFLVDRIALREQAIESFKEYMPNEPYWPKFGESSISKDRRFYIFTYLTMKPIVEEKINQLFASNPILQRLKNGEPIKPEQVKLLAQTLHDEDLHITIDLLRRVYMNKKVPFLKFIKHISGVEELNNFPDTISESFDKFIRMNPTFTITQLKFLELLKNYIIDNGDIAKKNLLHTPFTIIHPSGVRGVFSSSEIDEILQITQELAA